MSYFAKPNFIVYDEWFNDNLIKTKLDIQSEKTKTNPNIHEFFYEQSNYKIGASENNLQLDLKVNEKEIISNNYFLNTSKKYPPISHKKFNFFEKLFNCKIRFPFTNKLIYFLSSLGIIFIFVFFISFISTPKKSESNQINKFYILEKKF